MNVHPCVKRPVMCEVSDEITRGNIHEIATWCRGIVMVGLFEDLTGPEIEFYSASMEAHDCALLGNRIVKFQTGEHIDKVNRFVRVTADEFQRDYAMLLPSGTYVSIDRRSHGE